MRSPLLKIAAIFIALIVAFVGFLYFKNRALMSEIRTRLQAGSRVTTTQWGDIEYAMEGH